MKRLLRIGAKIPEQTSRGGCGGGGDFVVLQDPDDNFFCVVQENIGESVASRT